MASTLKKSGMKSKWLLLSKLLVPAHYNEGNPLESLLLWDAQEKIGNLPKYLI